MQVKDIFISYAEKDEKHAIMLRGVLQDWFADKVWMRSFDLDSGDLIFNVLDTAMTEAKWVIFLISKAALTSRWIKTEAHFGTIRSLQSDDFRIIIVRLEECHYPDHLEVALRKSECAEIDLTQRGDEIDGFMEIANLIEETSNGVKLF